MIELLLASSLSCSDSKTLIDKVQKYGQVLSMSTEQVEEVITIIKEDNLECFL